MEKKKMKKKKEFVSDYPLLDYKAIGVRIRKQRTFLGMSREDLAKHIGITPTFLADIELGTKGFSLKSLNRFCKTLKMSSDSILYPPKTDAADKYDNILNILESCPENKLKIAEDILTLFLLSHDPVK
ncbi:MAG: helix-turn-helix transcriptional regulator [Eubacterium sp.]